MPLFRIQSGRKTLTTIEQKNFQTEKDLQSLIEANLQTVFNCRLVASEFPTGPIHSGRIDTLALSEDSNPVIIEYKKVESSDLVTQSLFYLSWINDHRGDYEIAAQKALGSNIKVDWSEIRVICIAPNYRKYDLHAVQMMGANIELWRYRLFVDGSLSLEEIFRRSYTPTTELEKASSLGKTLSPGKKAALTRAKGDYTVEEHLRSKPHKIKEVAKAVQEFIIGLDAAMEETPKKFYIAYKTSQNIACMAVQKSKVALFLKLDPKDFQKLPSNARDVSEIGHYGTGDLEITLKSLEDLEAAKPLIARAYNKVGG